MTNYQKLVLAMLCDIHEKLEIQDSVDPKLITEALEGDNTWGISWAYPGLLENEESPEHVKFVTNVLQMWRDIENSYSQLGTDDQVKVSTATSYGGGHKFPGFDGNNESDYLSAAHFMVERLGRFAEFKGRVNNSHMPTLEGYTRMLEAYERYESMSFGERSADELIDLLKARWNPENL